MGPNLSSQEFLLMQKYIRDRCGIQINEDKAYLIENRLSRLLIECGARSFTDLIRRLAGGSDAGQLAEKVIDAITIKETHWFRDKTPWQVMEEILLPAYLEEFRRGKRSRVRIWSAACSTGQEPYSTAMCIHRYLARRGIEDIDLSHFDILATDISPAVLQAAREGSYDSLSAIRGLDDDYRGRYLRKMGRDWTIDQKIKRAVVFQHFNLGQSYLLLGRFDIIFCRYVTIYFYEEFKREVFRKMASAMNPQGVLFLGNSEIFPGYDQGFRPEKYGDSVYYRVTGGRNENTGS